jgi:hypothetical protein
MFLPRVLGTPHIGPTPPNLASPRGYPAPSPCCPWHPHRSFTGAQFHPGVPPPGLCKEVSCFQDVTECLSLQIPLGKGLSRRFLSGKDLRGVGRFLEAAGCSFWSFLFSHFWSFLFSHYGETGELICKESCCRLGEGRRQNQILHSAYPTDVVRGAPGALRSG